MIDLHFGGSGQRFVAASGISKSRLSQLLSTKHQFGEAAAETVMDSVAHLTWIDADWFGPRATDPQPSLMRLAGFNDLSPELQSALAAIIEALREPLRDL